MFSHFFSLLVAPCIAPLVRRRRLKNSPIDCAVMMGKMKPCVCLFGAYLYRTGHAISDMLTKGEGLPFNENKLTV